MSKTVSAALILLVGAFALPADAATPLVPGAGYTPTNTTRIAMSCGVGRTRDAMGRCRHHFNLFQDHRRFRFYKKKHCKPMLTPNGRVNFCKV